MTDDEGGDAVRLGDAQEVDGALAHLRDAARRALHVGLEDGLDGVDDEEFRLEILHMRLDRLKVRLADDEERVGKRLQAVGAHADLARALLARHIEDFLTLARDVGADAQCQARLADTRIAADQDHRQLKGRGAGRPLRAPARLSPRRAYSRPRSPDSAPSTWVYRSRTPGRRRRFSSSLARRHLL